MTFHYFIVCFTYRPTDWAKTYVEPTADIELDPWQKEFLQDNRRRLLLLINPYDGGLEYDEILRMDAHSDYTMRVAEFVQQGFSILRKVGLPAKDCHPSELCVMIRRDGQ